MNKKINQTNKQKNLCKSISAGQFREIGLYRHFIIDEKTREFSGASVYWVYLYNERITATKVKKRHAGCWDLLSFRSAQLLSYFNKVQSTRKVKYEIIY